MMGWIAMGGYGGYVWGSVGMVAACLLIELINLRRRYQAIRNENSQ